MLRKHFNLMKAEELKDLPFYSWQCLTLQLGNRDVDLVIKDEQQMDCFLKYLVHNLRTLDGNRNSANKVLKLMNEQSIKDYKRSSGKTLVSDSVMYNIKQTNEHVLFRKVYLKYLIMRIRAKISFMALERRMTIVELMITTIFKSYREIQHMGIYPKESYEQETRHESILQGLIKGEIKGFFRNIIEFNFE